MTKPVFIKLDTKQIKTLDFLAWDELWSAPLFCFIFSEIKSHISLVASANFKIHLCKVCKCLRRRQLIILVAVNRSIKMKLKIKIKNEQKIKDEEWTSLFCLGHSGPSGNERIKTFERIEKINFRLKLKFGPGPSLTIW